MDFLMPEDIEDKRQLIVVLEQAPLETAYLNKQIVLLNSDEHKQYIQNVLKKDFSIYRPDVLHHALLSLLDSPLNKAGLLKIYVHTANNVILDINPKLRIPRTYDMFASLFAQALTKLRVRAVESSETLIKVIKNPITDHLPSEALKIGTSNKATLVDLQDYVQKNTENKPIVFVIGAVSKGNPGMEAQYIDRLLDTVYRRSPTLLNMFGKLNDYIIMNSVMSNIFDIPYLLELYQILVYIKAQKHIKIDDPTIIYGKIEALLKYHLFEDVNRFLLLMDCHFTSIEAYAFLKKIECSSKNKDNTIRETLDKLLVEKKDLLNKVDSYMFKNLVYSVRLIQADKFDKESFKQYHRSFEILQMNLQEAIKDKELEQSKFDIIPYNTQIYELPYHQGVLLIACINILVQMLQNADYDNFLQLNHEFQIELIPKLQIKDQFFHSQLYRFASLMIDVTQNLVNLTELFAVQAESFQVQGIQRLAFSFNNIGRTFKVLRILLEESLFKYILEPRSSIQRFQDQEEFNKNSPNIKIIFHGLEDLNIDNPKACKLSLEILVQVGANQYERLDESQKEVLFWSFDKVKHFNLFLIILQKLIECVKLWEKYMPKIPNDYLDYIVQRSQNAKIGADRYSVSSWFYAEKQFIANAIEAHKSFMDSLEFCLLKTDSILNRDLSAYQKGTKPHNIQPDKFIKSIITSGLKVEHDVLTSIDIKVTESIKTSIEYLIAQLKPLITSIKQRKNFNSAQFI